MICPHCGENSTAIRGHCSKCNGLLGPTEPEISETGIVPPVFAGAGAGADAGVTGEFPTSVKARPVTNKVTAVVPPPVADSPNVTGGFHADGPSATNATRSGAARSGGTGPLTPGTAFGTRYHIIRLLGAGGMGFVYQAWDEELGVAVAIKVIRSEILDDPDEAEDIQRRFKRELLLARQVTHKN